MDEQLSHLNGVFVFYHVIAFFILMIIGYISYLDPLTVFASVVISSVTFIALKAKGF